MDIVSIASPVVKRKRGTVEGARESFQFEAVSTARRQALKHVPPTPQLQRYVSTHGRFIPALILVIESQSCQLLVWLAREAKGDFGLEKKSNCSFSSFFENSNIRLCLSLLLPALVLVVEDDSSSKGTCLRYKHPPPLVNIILTRRWWAFE